MKRLLCLHLILALLPSTILARFTIDRALRDTLTARALTNLNPLPEDIAHVYQTYLADHPDGIMAYLVMAEKSATLWHATPQDLLSNYRQIQLLLDREDFNYTPEFFLSYIAKITVGNEQLTPYRERFARLGLQELRAQYPDLQERIRAVNLWCRENMTFVSTSGRTQDPISIVDKSHIGRCGEMQVFFISACRTVGIPARPAWTPWWPHTDNNHAWTEVFVEGNWHYVGSAEPAYHLNSTWFTHSVNKALLILARSSFPDSLDDVVSVSDNISYVNSTRYYQQTRNISFHVIDLANNPVAEAGINIMAFNFSQLRPLLEIKTDSLGWAQLVISRGSFLAVAFKDSLFDYVSVPFDSSLSASYTLRIRERSWEDENLRLEYPPGMGKQPEEPEAFTQRNQLAAAHYHALIDSIQSLPSPGWAPGADSNFVQLFSDSRNNKQPLLELVKAHPELPATFWQEARRLDEKFYWQANRLQWENLYDNFQALPEAVLTEEARSVLLSPSVYYEPLPGVRVPTAYVAGEGLPTTSRITAVIDLVHSQHTIDKTMAPSGLLALDELLAATWLQDYQFKMLCCYALKANHIPAQYTRIPATVMVLADSVWRNYDVVENSFTRQPPDTDGGALIDVRFVLQDDAGLPVTLNPDNISTTLFQEGSFYYNDRQLEYDREQSWLSGQLEPGEYQVQFCIRESGEVTRVKLVSLQVEAGDTVDDTLTFDDFQRNWQVAVKKYHLFLNNYRSTETGDLVLLLGDHDNEPVQRLAERIRSHLSGQRFLWVGGTEWPGAEAEYIVDGEYAGFLTDHPELNHRLVTCYYDGEGEQWYLFEGIWDLLYK